MEDIFSRCREDVMEGTKMNLKVILDGLSGVVFIGITILLSPVLRPWYRRWGATESEARQALPGDNVVPHPKSEINLATTVQAPVEKIWPWFAQLGCGRGGWYSYDLLDNGGIPSAKRILPEHQRLEVGDIVKAMPKGEFGFPVAGVEPCRVLCLAGILNTKTGQPPDPQAPPPEAYFGGDQVFFMQPAGPHITRLIFRMRTDWNPSFANTLAYRIFLEPISFVMMRKMMINVKKRAETYNPSPAEVSPC
jgi:proline iminopeptidase